MFEVAAVVVLVALILLGALLPLKYTARMHLPKRPGVPRQDASSRERENEDESARPE
jgi:hypothetical protein